MRADRLLRMMMILQTRGRLTARILAEELEVTERTVYRDVIALSSSGVPIYTEKGPGGGIELFDEYRTSLTGLSPEEVKALFVVNIPAAMTTLGIGDEIQSAWLKLSSSLPQYLKETEAGVRQRIMIDQEWWQQTGDHSPSFISELYRAIWEDQVVQIEVQYGFGYRAKYQVEAYSLIVQGQRWFLVCRNERNFKVFWLSDIQKITVLDQNFPREAAFDLPAFWRDWSEQAETALLYNVELLLTEKALDALVRASSAEVKSVGEQDEDGWKRAVVSFDGIEIARSLVLGLGNGARILSPEPFLYTVKDFASQVLALYEQP